MSDKPEIVLTDRDRELITRAISETMKAVMPYMQPAEPVPAQVSQAPQAPAQQTQPLTSNNVRTRVAMDVEQAFQTELRENSAFMARLANSPASDFVEITIPRIYAQYLGPVLPAAINGSIINIPIDNRPYRIHKLYLPIVKAKLEYEDEKIDFYNKTGGKDVTLVDRNYING